MIDSKKYFGTDGIRGRVGQHPITPEFMLKLGWAAGKALAGGERRLILVGKDTRISGYMFESALEAGLSSSGTDVSLLGPMPTPAIAYLTRTFHAAAGIVISASHNAYYDNGIKFFTSFGTKLDDATELKIERYLEEPMVMVESDQIGKVNRISDASGRYIEFCKSHFPTSASLTGYQIVLDCANGATYHVGPAVFRELGAQVTEIGVKPNGLNINRNSGSTHPEQLRTVVLEKGADLGIAFDGDGDRVIMVDHRGEIVDGDELLFIIALSRKERGHLDGGVVGTLMSNFGMELALQEIGVPFARVPVGDRYVLADLIERNWQLGGESSGHLLCRDLTSTGDGIVSALQVMSALVERKTSLHEIKQAMKRFPQRMINVQLHGPYEETDLIRQAISAAEKKLAGQGRVLLRPSGTEPVVRVMVEGRDELLVGQLAQELADEVIRGI